MMFPKDKHSSRQGQAGGAPRGGKFDLKNIPLFSLPRFDNVVILLVFAVAMLGLLCGEKISVNDGFGWDGYFYAGLARDPFSVHPPVTPPDAYTIQRILPSLIVHYTFRIPRIFLTDGRILLGFGVLNALSLTLSACVWALICREKRVGLAGKTIGYLGLFGGFALTKWPSFYPVLTDFAAFAISMGMLYFYLKKNRAALLLLTLAGAFTWPVLIVEGVFFFVFAKEKHVADAGAGPAPRRLALLLALVASLVVLGGILWSLQVERQDPTFPIPPVGSLLPVSIAVTLLFWFFAVKTLMAETPWLDRRYWSGRIRPAAWLVSLAAVVVIKVVQNLVALPGASPDASLERLVHNIFLSSVVTPGKSLVTHLFFFGPVVLLALFWWKPMTGAMRDLGPGMVLNVLFGLLLLTSNESRTAITVLPVMILPLAQVADSRNLRPGFLWFFAGLTLLFSRVWLPLGDTPAISRFLSLLPAAFSSSVISEPSVNVFYWASTGPWTTHLMYTVQLVIALLVGAILFFVLRKQDLS